MRSISPPHETISGMVDLGPLRPTFGFHRVARYVQSRGGGQMEVEVLTPLELVINILYVSHYITYCIELGMHRFHINMLMCPFEHIIYRYGRMFYPLYL